MNRTESTPMSFTGERFVPSQTGQIKYEHVHRYAIASQLVAGMNVLDLACGEGYGTNLLAKTAASVIGVDNSADAIDHASRCYSRPNTSFQLGTCVSTAIPTSSVDAVVSFETIEHVENHDEMLREIRRVLKPHGLLVISTPDKQQYSNIPNYKNPFHLRELYLREFQSLLQKYFACVHLYGQRLATASFVHPLDSTAQPHWTAFTGDAGSLRQQTTQLDAPLYLIAVCSDTASATVFSGATSIYIDQTDDVLAGIRKEYDEQGRKWEALIQDQERALQQRAAVIQDQERALQQRAAVIQDQERALQQRAAVIQDQERALQQKAMEAVELREQIAVLVSRQEAVDKELANLYASRGWRTLRIYYAMRSRIAMLAGRGRKGGTGSSSDVRLVADSGLFDKAWYLQQNPDVARAGVDPLEHYLRTGASEGRDPNPLFDTDWYLKQNPAVAQSGKNPLTHYLQVGAAEGLDPNPLFDTDWYLQQNPAIAQAGKNPLAHYLQVGANEGRDPNPLFDTDWYLKQNPDVAKAGMNPLAHYLRFGSLE